MCLCECACACVQENRYTFLRGRQYRKAWYVANIVSEEISKAMKQILTWF